MFKIRIAYGQLFPGKFCIRGDIFDPEIPQEVVRQMFLVEWQYNSVKDLDLYLKHIRTKYASSKIDEVTCLIKCFFINKEFQTQNDAVMALERLNLELKEVGK